MTNQLKRLGILLSPTQASLVLVIAVDLVVIATQLIKSGNAFYSFLLGSDSSLATAQTSHQLLSKLYETVFGNPLLNKILFFVFWIMLGMVAYVIVMSIANAVGQTDEAISELNQIHSNRLNVIQNFGAHLVFQASALMGLVFYSIFFLRFLLPFSVLCLQILINTLPELRAIKYGLLALVVLSLSLHAFIVMLRLLTLRLRLLGSES